MELIFAFSNNAFAFQNTPIVYISLPVLQQQLILTIPLCLLDLSVSPAGSDTHLHSFGSMLFFTLWGNVKSAPMRLHSQSAWHTCWTCLNPCWVSEA